MARTKSFLSKTNGSTIIILKHISEIKNLPSPWQKSIRIEICIGFPMLLGLIFMSARISNVVIGSFIGLIGFLL